MAACCIDAIAISENNGTIGSSLTNSIDTSCPSVLWLMCAPKDNSLGILNLPTLSTHVSVSAFKGSNEIDKYDAPPAFPSIAMISPEACFGTVHFVFGNV